MTILILAIFVVLLVVIDVYLIIKLRVYKRMYERMFGKLSGKNNDITFAHMIAHDLKNPIISMYGMLELLEDSDLNETKTAHLIDRLKHNLKDMNTLVDDTMKISEKGNS